MIALVAITRHPLYGPWVRGQLTLAGLHPRTPLNAWLDAVHATIATAPSDVLSKLNDQLTVNAVAADPEGARETWGVLPEHQVQPSAERLVAEAGQDER